LRQVIGSMRILRFVVHCAYNSTRSAIHE
jgi:hypothetical protein